MLGLSPVCNVSCVTCHMSLVLFCQSGQARPWRVCYQGGCPVQLNFHRVQDTFWNSCMGNYNKTKGNKLYEFTWWVRNVRWIIWVKIRHCRDKLWFKFMVFLSPKLLIQKYLLEKILEFFPGLYPWLHSVVTLVLWQGSVSPN